MHFGKPFETKVKFKFSADEDAGGQIFTEGLFIADLKNLNFAAASVDCRSFTLRRGKEKIFIKASARDLLNPHIAFSAQGNSLTENLLKGLVPANIRFKFGKFKLNSEIDANPEEKSLNFKYLNFVSGKSMLKSKGVIRWGQEGIKFDFSQSLNVDIEEIFSILGISPAKARFSGSAQVKADINNKEISGRARGKNLSAVFKKSAIKLSEIGADCGFRADFSLGKAVFERMNFYIFNSTVASYGTYDAKKRDYHFFAESVFELKNAGYVLENYLSDPSPEGSAAVSCNLTKTGFKAEAVLKNAAVNISEALKFDGLNGSVIFNSPDAVKTSSMSGRLNGQNFTLSALYVKDLRNIMLQADIKAEKFFLPQFPRYLISDSASGRSETAAGNELPYYVHLKLSAVSPLTEVPHITADNLEIKARS